MKTKVNISDKLQTYFDSKCISMITEAGDGTRIYFKDRPGFITVTNKFEDVLGIIKEVGSGVACKELFLKNTERNKKRAGLPPAADQIRFVENERILFEAQA